MVRPKHDRYVASRPTVTYFKPQGVPMVYLEEAQLSVEGLEAVRLADLEGLTAAEAASRMRISRHTFGRILAEARAIIAGALVSGQALRIEGGNWVFDEFPPACGRPKQSLPDCYPMERPSDIRRSRDKDSGQCSHIQEDE